ncbi:dual specificity protein kinase CLK2-like isoform X2 [Pseudophryne corroboree]|uniref:dual specificity protein kinase CLK2-like isoform X2 n=1 Tax=Pseudophryne corroboree TaxID=495146 RepID=UPI003082055B
MFKKHRQLRPTSRLPLLPTSRLPRLHRVQKMVQRMAQGLRKFCNFFHVQHAQRYHLEEEHSRDNNQDSYETLMNVCARRMCRTIQRDGFDEGYPQKSRDDGYVTLKQQSRLRSCSRSSARSHLSSTEARIVQEDPEANLAISIGDRIGGRYEIVNILGEGACGQVLHCLDHYRGGSSVALKISKMWENMEEAAFLEIRMLNKISGLEHKYKHLCTPMLNWLYYQGRVCIEFELLGLSTYDFQKKNNFLPYPINQLRHMSEQLFQAVKFLHDNRITHTDLKPDNILFVNSEFEEIYNKEKSCVERCIKNTDIRLADFGCALLYLDHHDDTIAARDYRAPEVILGLDWSHSVDIWSIGCTLFEFYTGDTLFLTTVDSDIEHLAVMEQILGPIPSSMIHNTSKQNYFRSGRVDCDVFTRLHVQGIRKPLKQYMVRDSKEEKKLFNLMEGCLQYEPSKRLTAAECLRHPFFKYLLQASGTCRQFLF